MLWFCYWTCRQNLLVSVLVKTQAIPESWEEYDLQEGLQNFLVVVEMVFFAIAHIYVFSHKPYIDPAAAQVPCIATCLRMLDIRDVADDVREHFVDPLPRPKFRKGRGGGGVGSGGTSDLERGDTGGSSEESPLLGKPVANGTRLKNVISDRGEAMAGPSAVLPLPDGSGKLSDLSYDILTFRELDSTTKYGLRARMIATACQEEDKERGSPKGEGPERKGGSSSSSAERSSGEISPIGSLSPNREKSPLK